MQIGIGMAVGLGGGAVEAFVTSITPTVGANVIVNGDFSAWTAGNPDGFTVTQSPPNREITQVDPANSHGGGGVGAMNVYSDSTLITRATPTTNQLLSGKFYRYSVNISNFAAGLINAGSVGEPFRTIWGVGGVKAHTVFMVGTNGAAATYTIENTATPTNITLDDLSMLPLSNVYSGKITGNADFVITANLTMQAGESIGFIVNADTYPTPSNCVMVLIRSVENYNSALYSYYISILKCVSGVWSLVTESSSLTYAAAAQIKIIKSGTGYSVCYNNIYSSISNKSATISDAGIVNNALHWQVSTHASNLYANPLHTSAVGKYKIFGIGDSKTVGVGGTDATAGYFKYFANKVEFPIRNAIGGNTAAAINAQIAAALANRSVPVPDAVLINLGTNDIGTPTAQATFETAYLAILDAVHTKWPTVQCYLAKVWARGYDANADTLAGYIDNIIAARSTFAHAGIDERILLKGSDNGVTYTADGTHPNDAGYVLTAAEWSTILGY